MIPQTTEAEALWMTACPACGAHKGAGVLLCLDCSWSRKDVIPYACTKMSFAAWLKYVLSNSKVLTLMKLSEPDDFKD